MSKSLLVLLDSGIINLKTHASLAQIVLSVQHLLQIVKSVLQENFYKAINVLLFVKVDFILTLHFLFVDLAIWHALNVMEALLKNALLVLILIIFINLHAYKIV